MEKKYLAVVTGGSSGIGFAISKKLVSSGVKVIILGRRESLLQEAVSKLNFLGDVEYIRADVSNQKEVENAVNTIIQNNHQIDYLINNAGGNELLSTEIPLEEAEKKWDRVIESNLKGTFLMSVAVAPHLTRQSGRIINLSSIGAFTGGSSKGALAYSAAKAGILGLTRALARELMVEGITVNAVAPGFIYPTNFFGGPLPDDLVKNYEKQIPAGRSGTPEEIAGAVSYLLSKDAGYITGEVLNINGGWLFGR